MKKSSILILLLVAAGLVLNFAFSGHDFLAYTLYLIAFLILLFRLVGKTAKRLISLLLILGIGYFVFLELPIIQASSGDGDFEVQYVIVLGAAVKGETPSLALTERLDAALDYLNAHPDCSAVVSGGQGSGEDISEAEAMKRYLVQNGIAPERIIKEDLSTSTRENLQYSFDIIRSAGADPEKDAAVVTSEYHIYRTQLIAHSMGVSIKGIPAETTHITVRVNYFIREAFGVVKEKLFA